MEENGASSSSGANQNIFYHKQFRRKGIYLKNLPLTPTVTNPLSDRKTIYGKLKEPQIQIDEVPNNSQKEEYEFVDPLGWDNFKSMLIFEFRSYGRRLGNPSADYQNEQFKVD